MPTVVTPGGRIGDNSPLGTPGGRQNWVDKRGGLPNYVRIVARGIAKQRGIDPDSGQAISMAVAAIKRWARGGDNVSPAVQGAAAAALAKWEAMKGSSGGKSRDRNLSIPTFNAIRLQAGGGGSAYNQHVLGGRRTLDLDWSAWNDAHQTGPQESAEPDNLSAATHSKLSAFQAKAGLPQTGTLDPQTVAYLNNPGNAGRIQREAAASAASKKADADAKKKAAADKKAKADADRAAKKSASDAARAAKAKTSADAAGARQAGVNGRKAISAGGPVQPRTRSLSVPLISSGDGPRTMHLNSLIKAARKERKRRSKKR